MIATNRWAPLALGLLRIMAALLFLEHGLMKVAHFPAAMPGAPTPLPPLMVAAACIEILGGGLVALGLLTRPAAFLCSGEMAIAYFMVHAQGGFWPALNGGDAAILFSFIFLYLAAEGPGALSVDSLIGARRAVAV